MASWGPSLYQDDLAEDVRNYYLDQLKLGKTNDDVTYALIDRYKDEISDVDDAPIFWFALADTQWELGKTLPVVKENALKWLSEGSNLRRWEREMPKEAKARKKVLDDLHQKLNSPMPSPPKVSDNKFYVCEWKIGDVFAYKLDSDYANEKGVYGRYFLFHKVDETTWHPGHVVPVVRVKITKNGILPKTEKEFDDLEYVQTSVTKYEDRFLTSDGRFSTDEQIAKKTNLIYEADEYGFLPGYYLILINTSKKIIPKKLVYVGNFQNIKSPNREFRPHSKLSITAFMWKYFDKLMIDTYFGYNLKQYQIYQRNQS